MNTKSIMEKISNQPETKFCSCNTGRTIYDSCVLLFRLIKHIYAHKNVIYHTFMRIKVYNWHRSMFRREDYAAITVRGIIKLEG